jgi:hypothetical protein
LNRLPILCAVGLGCIAGAISTVDGRLGAGLGLGAIVLLIASACGIARLAESAWFAAAFFAPTNALRLVQSVTLADVALVVATVATVASATVAHRRVSLRPPDAGLLGGLMLFIAAGLIGTVFVGHPTESLVVMSKFLGASVGSLVAIAIWSPSAEKLRRFCWAWLAGAVLNVAWAASGHSPTVTQRPEGFTTHPNHLGTVCVLGFGLALGLAASASGRERTVARICLAMLALGVVLSGSRSAAVGLLFVVPFWSVLSSRWTLALRCLGCGALLAIALGSGVLQLPANNGAGRLLGGASSERSDSNRLQLLEDSVHQFTAHPVTGEGFGFPQLAHNIYFQGLIEGGPLALLGLALVAASVARPGLRVAAALRRGPVDRRLMLPLGMLSGYGGYLVISLFQNTIWDRYLWLFIAASLALTATLTEHEDSLTSSVA